MIKHLRLLKKKTITKIVIGNKACDIDSIASALIYSYMSQDAIHPIVYISKKDIKKRNDILYLLKFLNIKLTDLFYFENLNIKDIKEVVLVDHNDNYDFFNKVTAIYDHHYDQKLKYPKLKKKVIKKTTSAISIVTPAKVLSKDLACLIAGTLWLDSYKLTKIFVKERNLFNKLVKSFNIKTSFLANLLAAKKDISNLTPVDILLRDLKEIRPGFAISVVPMSIGTFKKIFTSEIIDKFCCKYGYTSFLIILNSYSKYRYLILKNIDHKIFNKFKRISDDTYQIEKLYTRKNIVKMLWKWHFVG